MKILFLIHDDYAAGGLQRSTMAAARCLSAAGHDATVLCLQLVVGGFAESFDFVRGVSNHGANRHAGGFALLKELRRYVTDRRPDLCIGMGQSTSAILRMVTIGCRWTRVYGSERAYPPMLQMSWKWRTLRALTIRRLDGIVCQTRRTADYYRERMGIAADRLIVIPNVVERPLDPLPAPSSTLAHLADNEVIACVGRHDWQKGFDLALPIFATILRERPAARLLLVGEGDLEAQHREQAEKLGLRDRVLFLPRFDHLAEIWSQIDVFLLTSRYEGIPNVLAEAMAYGKACVAFDCPTGPSELITDGIDGYLVNVGDEQMAADRCLRLLRDRNLRDRMGEAARSIADRLSQAKICHLWQGLAVAQSDQTRTSVEKQTASIT
ncbi:glycosyltransferase [Sphingomonas sp. GB1N7]|uniref:glycosyltransferase n=1 Tax=Parasphingomonas caseinilytica TaxID=3096158 RepID=UPI002FCAC9DB